LLIHPSRRARAFEVRVSGNRIEVIMSHEIRHFLVFVEQDSSFGRPLPDESVTLPLSSALREHFVARAEERPSPAVAVDPRQTPHERGVDPGSR
jgi:hypothetical protein